MYQERKILLEKIEGVRRKPLISYITSIRPNMGAPIAGDAITSIIEQIETVKSDDKEVDFLIISNGGDPIAALRIITLLRERFKKVTVLLPYVAYSAATVLSLGADEIVMHPYSNLGPVDPQLTVSHSNAQGQHEQLQFSSEDLRNYIDFLKEDIGITDQEYLIAAVEQLLKDVGTLPIGSAKRGQQLSLTLSEKLLSWHIKDTNKAKSIAKALNSSYYHHAYAVGRKEAKAIGLPISKPSPELEKLMWQLWMDYSSEMKCEEPFDVVHEVMSNQAARNAVSNVPVVNLPANTPPDLANQIIVNIAQQTQATIQPSIKQRTLIAAIESSRLGKAIYNDIDIVYWRNADMSLGANCTISGTGWIENK